MGHKIDLVIPFVDNNDPVWRKMFINFCMVNRLQQKIVDLHTDRYEDNLKLINYQLKLVNKNMPFINNIFLLLSNKEQAPKDLPSNVKIIYHAQFIPSCWRK